MVELSSQAGAAANRDTEVSLRNKLPANAHSAGAGAILTQTSSVRTSCFPGRLNAVLRDISGHFGRAVVVTSGHRGGGRRGSYHHKCQAADIQIAGVSPSAIARYARSLSAVGGVGTYGHTRSVHVDVGDRVFSWYGNRRRSAMLGGSGCCQTCTAMASASGKPRFEAVCTG
ncbi:MAG: YcbK family protein [Bosea sp. (in: a-proteobacteria)]